jgi:hypothetical protein
LDLDYPPLPLAAGTAALGGGGGGSAAHPQHSSIAAAGRLQSAPRLDDNRWLTDSAVVPPTRATSEAGAQAAAASAVAAGSGGIPANPSDDSSVCVFCMDAPATAGVLHGDSVHRCGGLGSVGHLGWPGWMQLAGLACEPPSLMSAVFTAMRVLFDDASIGLWSLVGCRCLCRECAVHLKESNVELCPMCREHIDAYIMRVF